jgi:hypothetical protein
LKATDEPDSDPLGRVWIRTNISWIWDTAYDFVFMKWCAKGELMHQELEAARKDISDLAIDIL